MYCIVARVQIRAITLFAIVGISLAAADATAQEARFVVRVVDYGGRAIPDAQVVLFRVERDDTLTRVARDTTGDAGVVVFQVAPHKRYRLRASRPGYEYPGGEAHSQPPEGDVGILLRMRLIEPVSGSRTPGRRLRYGSLTGRVLSARGEPLANESIMATSTSNPGRMYGATTGDDGRYFLSVPPDRYTVKAGSTRTSAPLPFRSLPTYELLEPAVSPAVIVDADATVAVDLWLQPLVLLLNLTVTALDDSGAPAEDTEVEVFGHRDPPTPNFVRADFLATYHTKGEPVVIGPTLPGPVTIIARSINREEPLAGMKSIDLQGSPHKVAVPMTLAARMSGRIDFEGRDVPLHGPDGIRLAFQLSGGMLNLNSVASKIADADGSFDLRGLIGEGCLRVYGLPAGWRLEIITYSGTDIKNRLITLESGDIRADVRVRVVRGAQQPGAPPVCTR